MTRWLGPVLPVPAAAIVFGPFPHASAAVGSRREEGRPLFSAGSAADTSGRKRHVAHRLHKKLTHRQRKDFRHNSKGPFRYP